jgi:hypothetical protein
MSVTVEIMLSVWKKVVLMFANVNLDSMAIHSLAALTSMSALTTFVVRMLCVSTLSDHLTADVNQIIEAIHLKLVSLKNQLLVTFVKTYNVVQMLFVLLVNVFVSLDSKVMLLIWEEVASQLLVRIILIVDTMKSVNMWEVPTDVLMLVVTFNVDLTLDVSLIIITVPVSVLMDILETHLIQEKAVNKSLDVKTKMIVLKCMFVELISVERKLVLTHARSCHVEIMKCAQSGTTNHFASVLKLTWEILWLVNVKLLLCHLVPAMTNVHLIKFVKVTHSKCWDVSQYASFMIVLPTLSAEPATTRASVYVWKDIKAIPMTEMDVHQSPKINVLQILSAQRKKFAINLPESVFQLVTTFHVVLKLFASLRIMFQSVPVLLVSLLEIQMIL